MTATRTILFTDVVGSTALRSSLGDVAADEFGAQHDHLLRDAVATWRGVVVKGTGDGVMAVFEAAADAAACAVAMQQAIHQLSHRRGIALSIRVGLSVGDVASEDGDWSGTPIVEAARLEAAAEPNQILASTLVRALAGSRTELVFDPVGLLDLKGLPAPLDACSIRWEPVARSGPLPLPPPLTLAGSFDFVGRANEQQILAEAWRAVSSGESRTVMLGGEAGVGKTRLVRELATRVHESGGVVVAGGCDEEAGLPYKPFVEMLHSFIESAPEDLLHASLMPYRDDLSRMVPELAVNLPATASTGTDPDSERHALFVALTSWLGALSVEVPVLAVLEDLHWATKPTTLLLRHLQRSYTAGGLLLLGTYRPSDIGQEHPLTELLADWRRAPEVERLTMGGLDDVAVSELLAEALGHSLSASETRLATTIREVTAGNAFFAAEVVRGIGESGPDTTGLVVPESVREVVSRRLAPLSERARDVLTACAAVGPVFDVRVVSAVAALEEQVVLDALDIASARHLVNEEAFDRYRFAHALVRDTILANLSTSRRTRIHQRVADSIQALFPTDIDDHLVELAYHLGEVAVADSTVASLALEYTQRAGDQAVTRLAPEEASRHYARALNLLDQLPPDPQRRCDLYLALGAALIWGADFTMARSAYDAAAELARDLHDGPRLARAAIGFRGPPRMASNQHSAREVTLFEAALSELDETEPALCSLVHAYLARTVLDSASAQRHCADAVRLARDVDDPVVVVNALFSRAAMLFLPESAHDQLRITFEALDVARAGASPDLRLQALANHLVVVQHLDDRQAAQDAENETREIAEQFHHAFYLAFLELLEARRLIARGELDDAEAHSGTALSIASDEGTTTTYFAQLMLIRGLQGRAEELLGGSKLRYDPSGGPAALALHLAAVLLHIQAGRMLEAQDAFEPLVQTNFNALSNGTGWTRQLELALLADICARLDHQAGAVRLLTVVTPYEHLHAHASVAAYLGPFALHLGMLESVLGHCDQAIEHLQAARAYLEHVGDLALEFRAEAELGAALVVAADGRSDEGNALLRRARFEAAQLNLVDIVNRCDLLKRGADGESV